ncbi:MAG: bifunctional demethylmenaquinone methyltransferase/2-methoxy-6-polyprenyl-1,4-benzoquinol methylase UbiE [Bacteroidales bacterium]|nr:bifunctional demethylmenaquinone methyltransferase/2-methoxy-6-polyprenyl-1,4-benzoquinol methylase UbiE [Bacteroidales bacterium]
MTTQNGKKQQVRTMFNNIAHRYDFLNHFLSAGIDYSWRKKAIRLIGKQNPTSILDVATGTADLAIEAVTINPQKIIGIDIAEDMLEVGKKKILKKNLQHIISLEKGDSENLQFDTGLFDAAMVAFGVRNFENLEKGLAEMFRVLKPNGMILVLEFSKPGKFPVKQLYNFYFRNILPFMGRLISGDSAAYTYLPESVSTFPDGEDFIRVLKKVGFRNTGHQPLTFGIASIYTAYK